MIDLQHMINPLGPSQKAVEAIKNNLSSIHKYTGPLKELLQRIAVLNTIHETQVFLTDGADGALTLIAQSIFQGKTVLIPHPCFHRYKDYPSYAGINYTSISPKDSLFIDEKRVLQTHGDILLLASPNNPTGFEISEQFLLNALDKFETIILDETLLLSFEGKQQLIAQHPNLIIVRSFSKLFGLAGLRVGYIIASEENINRIKAVSTPFKVNYLGQVAALAALDDKEYLKKTRQFVDEELAYLSENLHQESVKLCTSFCYCISLTEAEKAKLQKKILFSGHVDFGIHESTFFRFCIGLHEHNQKIIALLGETQ